MSTLIGFYMLSALAVGAALWLVLSRNLLHAVLALAVASLAIAGLMLTLAAEFMAFVLVLVYVGAVVVLGVFAVMLTGHFEKPLLAPGRGVNILAGMVSLALTVLIIGVALIQPRPQRVGMVQVTVAEIGRLLLTEYVLPFELVSILLLAALIGAIVIARGQEAQIC